MQTALESKWHGTRRVSLKRVQSLFSHRPLVNIDFPLGISAITAVARPLETDGGDLLPSRKKKKKKEENTVFQLCLFFS